MAKPEWGLKRVCQSCSAKFYDMQRNPIVCPKCGAAFDPDALLKSRRPRPTPVKAAAAKEAAPEKAEGDDDAVLLDDNIDDDDIDVSEDDDAVLANTDDLDGDSDLGDVVIEDEEEER